MQTLALINNKYNSLTKSEQLVADYVQEHPEKVILESLQILAQKCGTSDATVLRFCRSLGFSGYQDFKSALIPELLEQGVPINQEINIENDEENLHSDYLNNLYQWQKSTIINLDKDIIHNAAQKIAEAEQIIIVGLAGSGGVGRILSDSLLSINKRAYYFSDRVEIERVSSLLGPEDVLIAISHSGETEEVCLAVERAKEQGSYTLSITNFSPSRLYSLADETLLTSVSENLLGSYSCIPRIIELSILELIVMFVVKELH